MSGSSGKRKGGPKGRDHRRGDDHRRTDRKPSPRRSITTVPSGPLPKWVREEIIRSTPKARREPAFSHLTRGMERFADERYPASVVELRKAKKLAPRSATIRELLGLAAYRSGYWEEALRELRTFRRLTGDMIHTPVELDCLRALDRPQDVKRAWERIQERGVSGSVSDEARVVYASFLLDQGEPREAWKVIKPGRLVASPKPSQLRRWFVAAKVALAAGDPDAARRLIAALDEHEPDFEGVEELRRRIS